MSNIEPFFHCNISPTFHFNISARGLYFPKEAYPLKSILVHKVAIGRFPFTKKFWIFRLGCKWTTPSSCSMCWSLPTRRSRQFWRRFRVSATQASLRAFQWKIPGNKWNYFRFLRWKRSDGDECFIYEGSQRFTSFMLFTAISCDAILNYDERREWTLLLQKTPSSIKIFHGIIF